MKIDILYSARLLQALAFKSFATASVLAVAGLTGTASAATILIDGTGPGYVKDGSFEAGSDGSPVDWLGNDTSSALAVDLGIGKNIAYRNTAVSGVAEGSQYAVVGTSTTGNFGVYLDTGYNLVEGVTFDLSFAHSVHAGSTAPGTTRTIDWQLFTTTTNTDAGTVDAVIASGNVGVVSNITSESFTGIGTVTGAEAGDRLFIAFTVGAGSSSGTTSQLDAVNLSVIPEPSTVLLGILGLVALLRRRR